MVEKAIINAKDKSVLSWWWLCIPLYILAALLVKSLFMPSTAYMSNLHELEGRARYSSLLFFFILPVFFIVYNSLSIRKIYFLTGSPKTLYFLKFVWFNLLSIIASIIILIIYSL